MTGNNAKLVIVNIIAHTKLGQILSISFQDIEQKRKSDINQGSLLCYRLCKKMTGNTPLLDLVNINAHAKFGQILSICSQDIEQI